MTKFIAEISSNHNQDLDRALRLMTAAREADFDAVKFQLFKLEQLFAPWALEHKPELRARQNWELPVTWLPTLARAAYNLGLEFSCTPFYPAAIDELYPYVDFYKISSYQLLQPHFLRQVALTGKPVVLSTGMATYSEISHAVNALCGGNREQDLNITLLHCTSIYPAAANQCHLATIGKLRELHKLNASVRKFGWSDHSHNVGVILQAVLEQRAEVIEMHFDLDDEEGVETRMGHCWTPSEVRYMRALLHTIDAARGNADKEINPHERVERLWRSDPQDGLRPLMDIRKND